MKQNLKNFIDRFDLRFQISNFKMTKLIEKVMLERVVNKIMQDY